MYRRLLTALVALLLALPFLVGLLHERAELVVRQDYGDGILPDPESFTSLLLWLYGAFAFFLFLWLAGLFFSQLPLNKDQLRTHLTIVLIIGGIPAMGIVAFYLFHWP